MTILRKIGGHSDLILNELQHQFGDDFVYSFNSFAANQDWAIDVFRYAFESKKEILAVETPLIGRMSHDALTVAEPYYRIGLNYASSYFGNNYFIPKTASPDRLTQILKNTGTIIAPWRTTGEHIIYAMQVPEDTSLLGLDVFAAAQYDLVMIRKLTDRPIIVTLHPKVKKRWSVMQRSKRSIEGFEKIVNLTGSEIATQSTHELFKNAWCTVCYTSGTAFDSVAAGVPVITLSERSFMRPLTSTSWYDILCPATPDRESWLSRVAYCQWTLGEIRNGNFSAHIATYLS